MKLSDSKTPTQIWIHVVHISHSCSIKALLVWSHIFFVMSKDMGWKSLLLKVFLFKKAVIATFRSWTIERISLLHLWDNLHTKYNQQVIFSSLLVAFALHSLCGAWHQILFWLLAQCTPLSQNHLYQLFLLSFEVKLIWEILLNFFDIIFNWNEICTIRDLNP